MLQCNRQLASVYSIRYSYSLAVVELIIWLLYMYYHYVHSPEESESNVSSGQQAAACGASRPRPAAGTQYIRSVFQKPGYFDNVDYYLSAMGLSESEQVDVKNMSSNQLAMAKCLSLWRRHHSSTATLKALIEILLSLRKEEIVSKVCNYYCPKHKS